MEIVPGLAFAARMKASSVLYGLSNDTARAIGVRWKNTTGKS